MRTILELIDDVCKEHDTPDTQELKERLHYVADELLNSAFSERRTSHEIEEEFGGKGYENEPDYCFTEGLEQGYMTSLDILLNRWKR